ncbi:ZAR1-like protein [Mya arenaria]|uniref:ZAR1-like protein n=1 Tax=Mya arenaria TaxID=6604 RepID=A0ABY7FQ78_MYAAR|nr:zygote arrest protein 1-like [Mya arenaria]WAR24378.1 ZAR1-like protein [Mya arenaria]
MYGFFECSDCGLEWESAKVYFKDMGNNVYYGQECKDCGDMTQPYRVEETTCSRCGKGAKTCDCDKTRHSDPHKPHRSDLCEKCRSGDPCM